MREPSEKRRSHMLAGCAQLPDLDSDCCLLFLDFLAMTLCRLTVDYKCETPPADVPRTWDYKRSNQWLDPRLENASDAPALLQAPAEFTGAT